MMHDLKVKFTNEGQAKAFIDAIFNKRNKDDENSTTLAQTLESNIKTIFNSAAKYVFELLQNADDASAQEVEFEIKNNHLRVSHSGNHFLPCDIDKICDNAKPDSNKSDDITKTGYKGVGFKATFCISETITIVSEYAKFRFDKSFFENTSNQNSKSRFPWAIIPIWTTKDYLAQTGFKEIDDKKVNFFLQNVNTLKVNKEINEIFSSLEVLLLLRNISKVTLKHAGIEFYKEKHNNHVILKQILNGVLQSQKCYLLFDEEIVIPDKIKEHLGALSPSECPEKLKTAEKVKITFAVELDKDNKPIIPKHAKLFSYLPTDILSGLPFWVNGEFLLKQDRGHLLNNDWNQFLLREIGKCQFRVLKCIAENKVMQLHVISLLPPDKMSNAQLTEFKYSYDEGFSEGAAETEFIPALDGKLLKLSDCVLDKHSFFAKEGGFVSSPETTALFPDVFIGEKSLIIEHGLEQKDKLIPFCHQRIFTIDQLLEKLEDYVKIIYPGDKVAFKKLLRFLARLNDYQLGEKLNQKRWLPLIHGIMQYPCKCFLSDGGENPFAKQFALDL